MKERNNIYIYIYIPTVVYFQELSSDTNNYK